MPASAAHESVVLVEMAGSPGHASRDGGLNDEHFNASAIWLRRMSTGFGVGAAGGSAGRLTYRRYAASMLG